MLPSKLIPLTLLFCATVSFAQPPDTSWTRIIGGDAYDSFNDVELTPDGGFILAGAKADSTGQWDAWVVKTDSLGSVEWERTLGDSLDDEAMAVKLTSDGGYIVAVSWFHAFVPPLADYCLWKLEADGGTEWYYLYGGAPTERPRDLVVSPTGYIWTVGYKYSSRDVWLLCCNSDGDSVWSRAYGGTNDDEAYSIKLTHDNGFIIAGYTNSFGAGSEDMWLLRLNANGDSLWSRTFGGGGLEQGHAVLATSDGGFVIGGWTHSFGLGFDNAYLVKVDTEGDFLWDKVYGDADQIFIDNLVESPDHSIYATGLFTTAAEVGNAWLFKMNAEGDSLGERHWVRDQFSVARSVTLLSDNSLVLAGQTSYEFNDFSGDGWLLKTEPDPLPTDEHFRPIVNDMSLRIYPNPFNSSTTFSYSLPYDSDIKLSLFDLLGRETKIIFDGQGTSGTHTISFTASDLPSGIYFAQLQSASQSQIQKIVLLK